MKEVNNNSRFRFISRIIIPAVIVISFIVVSIGGLIIYKYPWLSVTNEYRNAKSWLFSEPWPQSPLAEILHDKKKKRFPKAELERIYRLDVRRMEYLNVPILDVLYGAPVKHTIVDKNFRGFGFSEYPWPWFETSRQLGEAEKSQNVSYVLLPNPRGLALEEGILLAPGEEFEFNFPIAKLRRSFRFYVIPLNSGTLRISIGQYSWAKTFPDAEINIPQLISIPINDDVTTQLKILSSSAKIFLLSPKITQAEMSGSLAVQIAENSPIWKSDASLLQTNAAASEVDKSLKDEENLEISTAPVVITPEPTKESKVVAIPTPSLDEKLGSETKAEPLDSMNIVGNAQVLTQNSVTRAVGYNVLFLHVDDIPYEIFSNKELMNKIAPRLAGLLDASFVLPNMLDLEVDKKRDFRSVILGKNHADFLVDDPVLLRNELNNYNAFNLYGHLRDFGYHVLSIAPGTVFGANPKLSELDSTSIFGTKNFDSNDWNFARRRMKIDRDAQPLRGLEAVLGKEQSLYPSLVTSDYLSLREYLTSVSDSLRTFPDWKASEMYFPDFRTTYFASVVDFLQNWSIYNRQQRFFFHIWLNSTESNARPSAKDLLQIVKTLKVVGLWKEFYHHDLSRVVMLNRTIEQILDLLKIRLIAPRTIIVMVFDHSKKVDEKNRNGSASIYLPGAKFAKIFPKTKVNISDLVATSLSLVGVPLYASNGFEANGIFGKNLELVLANQTNNSSFVASDSYAFDEKEPGADSTESIKQRGKIFRYVMHIKPGEKGCQPFSWNSTDPIFGIRTTHSIIEMASNNNMIIYPCAIKAPIVTISWYQAVNDVVDGSDVSDSTAAIKKMIGGSFLVEKNMVAKDEYLQLFIGQNLLDLGNMVFSYRGINNKVIEKTIGAQLFDSGQYFIPDKSIEIALNLKFFGDSNFVGSDQTAAWFYRKQIER